MPKIEERKASGVEWDLLSMDEDGLVTMEENFFFLST